MRPAPSDPFVLACVVRLEAIQRKARAALATAERAIADTDQALRDSRALLYCRPVRDPAPPPTRRPWADEWAAVMANYPHANPLCARRSQSNGDGCARI